MTTTRQATDDTVREAVRAADAWAASSPPARAAVLRAVADAMDGAADELIALADSETRLGRPRLTGELARTTFQLRLFAEEVSAGAFYDVRIDRADASWPSGARPELRRYRTGLGPVLVFAASNFPFAFSVVGGDTASALAAGCPVVVKAHPGHPELSRRTAAIVAAAVEGSGAPPGVFGMVEGEQAGLDALRNPGIRAAAFTGSVRGGLALSRIAAERPEPIPFYGEMGSVNPVVVTPGAAGARAEGIAEGYAGSVTQGAGQFCTNPGLLFVPAGSGLDELIADRLRGVPEAPMLGERIARSYVESASTLGERAGVRKLCWPQDPDSLAPRLLSVPVDTFAADAEHLTEECFGPLGLVVCYTDPRELPDVLSALPGQLTTTLHAQPDEEVVPELAQALAGRSGRVLWGGWPTGVAVTYAMQHGGPFPATTSAGTTSVGTAAQERFLRPVSYQSWPQHLLPQPLRDDNPWRVPQHIHEAR